MVTLVIIQINIVKNLANKYPKSDNKLRQELTYAYHLCSLFGWDDLIYTHISARDPLHPDCYLINPFGLMFDEITPDHLLKVNLDGNIIGDNSAGYNPAGENIHGAIYRTREDVQAIVHLHTLNGMAISALKDGLLPLCQHSCHFFGQIAYHDYRGIAIDESEQDILVKDMAEKDVVIMRNHGTLTAGVNLAHAFCAMYTLEKAATVQLMALSTGRDIVVPDDAICNKVIDQTKRLTTIKNYQIEWDALVRYLKRKNHAFLHSDLLEENDQDSFMANNAKMFPLTKNTISIKRQ